VIVSLLVIFWFGPEKRGRSFMREHPDGQDEGIAQDFTDSAAAALK
jgi:SHS family lactate transporter-like MFS transporter